MNAVDDIFCSCLLMQVIRLLLDFLINDTRNGFSTQAANVIISTVSLPANLALLFLNNYYCCCRNTARNLHIDLSNMWMLQPTLCDTVVATINTKIVANPDFFFFSFTPVCNVFFSVTFQGTGTDLDFFIDSLNINPPSYRVTTRSQEMYINPPTLRCLTYSNPGIELFSNGDAYINAGAAQEATSDL
jgi:hypothetical protein